MLTASIYTMTFKSTWLLVFPWLEHWLIFNWTHIPYRTWLGIMVVCLCFQSEDLSLIFFFLFLHNNYIIFDSWSFMLIKSCTNLIIEELIFKSECSRTFLFYSFCWIMTLISTCYVLLRWFFFFFGLWPFLLFPLCSIFFFHIDVVMLNLIFSFLQYF